MVLGYAVYYFTRLSFTYVGLAMRSDLGLSMVQLGAISSLFPLAYMNSKFLSGVLSDVLGSPVLIFSLGLMCTGVLNIAFSTANTVPIFTLIWLLNGLFQGCGATPCNKMLVNWFPARSRGKWWSSWNASHNVGGFLIPLLAGGLAARYSWRAGMMGPWHHRLSGRRLGLSFYEGCAREGGLAFSRGMGSTTLCRDCDFPNFPRDFPRDRGWWRNRTTLEAVAPEQIPLVHGGHAFLHLLHSPGCAELGTLLHHGWIWRASYGGDCKGQWLRTGWSLRLYCSRSGVGLAHQSLPSTWCSWFTSTGHGGIFLSGSCCSLYLVGRSSCCTRSMDFHGSLWICHLWPPDSHHYDGSRDSTSQSSSYSRRFVGISCTIGFNVCRLALCPFGAKLWMGWIFPQSHWPEFDFSSSHHTHIEHTILLAGSPWLEARKDSHRTQRRVRLLKDGPDPCHPRLPKNAKTRFAIRRIQREDFKRTSSIAKDIKWYKRSKRHCFWQQPSDLFHGFGSFYLSWLSKSNRKEKNKALDAAFSADITTCVAFLSIPNFSDVYIICNRLYSVFLYCWVILYHFVLLILDQIGIRWTL